MKIRWLWFVYFIPYFLFSQNVLNGRLLDENKEGIVGASIVIATIETGNIIAYAISDNKGEYFVSFASLDEHLQVTIRSMGYAPINEIIKNETQTRNFMLREQHLQLPEVVVKPPRIAKRGDTISYTVSSFSANQDRSISDVLKRLPGIEVLDNGQILYEGTPIIKYYIEGLDLLEGKYKLVNENLQHKEVLKVQVLENHQPIKILDNLVFSDRAALNIQLKNSNIITGQAEVGAGFAPLLWEANITPMLFSGKTQAIASYQANDTGQNLVSQIRTLTVDDIFENSENNFEVQDWLHIQPLAPPNFSERYWRNNNEHLVTVNLLQKLKNDHEFRVNISYSNDYQQQNGNTQTIFFTQTDTVSLFESKYNQLFSNALETNLTLNKNASKNYFKNSLQFQGYWNGQNGFISNEQIPIEQNLSDNSFKFSNRLKSIYPYGKQLIHFDSHISFHYLHQVLQVNPGQFEDILNEGNSYKEMEQKIGLKTFFTNNTFSFTKDVGSISFSPKVGFQMELQNMESDLLKNENEYLTSVYLNNIDWNRFKIFAGLLNHYRKEKWRFSLNVPISYHSFHTDDSHLREQQRINQFSFEPRFSVNYDLNVFWKIKGSTGLSNSFGSVNHLYSAYILRNYRTLERFNSHLSDIWNSTSSVGMSYRNPIKSLFGYVAYSFVKSRNNLLLENILKPDGSTEINAYDRDNYRNNHNVSGRISKYFNQLKSSGTLSMDYNVQEFELILNNNLTDVQIINKKLGLKIDTNFTDWFNAEYASIILLSKNKIELQKNKNNKQQSQKLSLNFYPAASHLISFKTEFVTSNFFSNKDENFFADMLYRYTPRKGNMDFQISCTNIFNTGIYRVLAITAYSYEEINYRLRPVQVLFKMRFSI